MLRDLFLNAVWIAGTMALLAAVAVILKWSTGYVFDGRRETVAPVRVEPLDPLDPPEEGASTPVAVPPKPRSPTRDAQMWRALQGAVDDTIECGYCGREIKSAALERQEGDDPGRGIMMYECEHCGKKVGVTV